MGRKFVERMKIANSLIDASPVTYFACNVSSHGSFCYKSMFFATPYPFSRSTTKIVLLFNYCSSCAGYDVFASHRSVQFAWWLWSNPVMECKTLTKLWIWMNNFILNATTQRDRFLTPDLFLSTPKTCLHITKTNMKRKSFSSEVYFLLDLNRNRKWR